MHIPNPQNAEFYLSQLNYYRLSAYCLPFEQDHAEHKLIPGTSFDDVLNLYIFDRELRLLLLDAIERIEVSLRTQMAYQLSHRYESAHPHLKPELFRCSKVYSASFNTLSKNVEDSKEDFIKHLKKTYKETLPPIWAVVELMTMGQLSKWFSNIKLRKDRQAVSRIYSLDEKIMTSFCEHLSLVRNTSAHHARLWNRDIVKLMTIPSRSGPQSLIDSLNHLPHSDKNLKKIYNALTMIVYLLNIIAPDNHWKTRLTDLIDKHTIDTTKMGFPSGWKQRPMWI